MPIVNSNNIKFSATINSDYSFNFAKKLDKYSSEFANAYEAKNNINPSNTDNFYVLAVKKNYPISLDLLNSLREINDANTQKIADFGRIKSPDGEEVLGIVMAQPKGISLRDFIKQNGTLEDSYGLNNIFNQIHSALISIHSAGASHGSLNLDNIFYNVDNGIVTLKEFISEYSGFNQKIVYETYERMCCDKAGKKPYDPEGDYYAVGVVLTSLILGDEPFAGFENELIRRIKFENGSFESIFNISMLNKKVSVSSRIENLVKGLLHDRAAERWGDAEIKGWKKREASKTALSRVHKQTSTAFELNEIEFFSTKYLAHEIYSKWSETKKNLKIPDLARWLSFASKFPDAEKRLYGLLRGWQGEVIIPDDKLCRIVYMLDDEGPLRYKTVSFHPAALGNYYSYLLFSNNEEKFRDLLVTIDIGLVEGWIVTQANQDDYKPVALGWNARKVKFFLRKNEVGFGQERILYELNPYMPCLSPLVKDSYCINNAQLLNALNNKRLSGTDLEPDKSFMAFLCCQCDIDDSIQIRQIKNFPLFNKQNILKILAILAVASNNSGFNKLPEITNWMRKKLDAVVELFNSQKIKEKVLEDLDRAVESGSLKELFTSITNEKNIRKDVYGFVEARKQFKMLKAEVIKLKSVYDLDQLSYSLGLKIAVLFSFLICSVAIITVLLMNY